MNISSEGPTTTNAIPHGCFSKTIIENLGMRALLAAGIGDNLYHDRIFSSRITLPKMRNREYEALIFNFVIDESEHERAAKINSKALALLIFSYPRHLRKYVSMIESDLENLLQGAIDLPNSTSQILDISQLQFFIDDLQKSILYLETEYLLADSVLLENNWDQPPFERLESVSNT